MDQIREKLSKNLWNTSKAYLSKNITAKCEDAYVKYYCQSFQELLETPWESSINSCKVSMILTQIRPHEMVIWSPYTNTFQNLEKIDGPIRPFWAQYVFGRTLDIVIKF